MKGSACVRQHFFEEFGLVSPEVRAAVQQYVHAYISGTTPGTYNTGYDTGYDTGYGEYQRETGEHVRYTYRVWTSRLGWV